MNLNRICSQDLYRVPVIYCYDLDFITDFIHACEGFVPFVSFECTIKDSFEVAQKTH